MVVQVIIIQWTDEDEVMVEMVEYGEDDEIEDIMDIDMLLVVQEIEVTVI